MQTEAKFFVTLFDLGLIFTFSFCILGHAEISRLARNGLQQPRIGLEDASDNWDDL